MNVVKGQTQVSVSVDRFIPEIGNRIEFTKREDCEHYEDVCKRAEEILSHDEWFYLTSKEDYDLICEKKNIENRSCCDFPKFDEADHIGWVSFEWFYNDNGPDYFYTSNAHELKATVDELYAIKNPEE